MYKKIQKKKKCYFVFAKNYFQKYIARGLKGVGQMGGGGGGGGRWGLSVLIVQTVSHLFLQ